MPMLVQLLPEDLMTDKRVLINARSCYEFSNRRNGPRASMPIVPKFIRYAGEALLILVPLGVTIYFLAYPDKFDSFLDWLMKTLS
jgi:hypothetical protein